MSDATVTAEEPHALEGTSTRPPSADSKKEVVLASRYKNQPDVVLPHLSSPTARAYLTHDAEVPDREL